MGGSSNPIVRRVLADLVYDTKTQPLMPGVRTAIRRARRVLYTAEQTELVLQMTPDSRGAHIRVVGQVLDDMLPVEGASISLHGATVDLDDTADEDGDFRFVPVPAGRYTLNVRTEARVVSVTDLDIS
jgi:hypothetical protein